MAKEKQSSYKLEVTLEEQEGFFGPVTSTTIKTIINDTLQGIPTMKDHKLVYRHNPKPGKKSEIIHKDDKGTIKDVIVLDDNETEEMKIPHKWWGSFNVEGSRVSATEKRGKNKISQKTK